MWAFDKRFHTSEEDALLPALLPEPPAFEEGKWKFVEGNPVRRQVHDTITLMIRQMNEAIRPMKRLEPLKVA